MKFSKVSLLAASASVALSVPVAVTVTQHVHEAATVMVQGIVYVENGHTLTSLVTEGVPTAPGAPATATATATAPIVVANAQVDNVAPSATQEGTPVVESSVSTQIQVFTTVSTIKSVQATQQAAQDDVTSSSSSTPSTPSTTSATPSTTSATPSTTSATPSTTSATPSTTSTTPSTTSTTSTTPSTTSTTSTTPSTTSTTSTTPTTTSTTSATPSSTSTQSTASAAQSSSGSDFATSMVNEHNTKRALHKDTGSLTWSDTLATYAQNYADSYDCSGNLVHSGGAYGENLALGYGTTASVDAWYNEISSYDYSNPGFTEDAGHFTQVVWKGTSQVGCGLKSCGGQWGDYVICSYQNPGNYIGEFAENVMPLA